MNGKADIPNVLVSLIEQYRPRALWHNWQAKGDTQHFAPTAGSRFRAATDRERPPIGLLHLPFCVLSGLCPEPAIRSVQGYEQRAIEDRYPEAWVPAPAAGDGSTPEREAERVREEAERTPEPLIRLGGEGDAPSDGHIRATRERLPAARSRSCLSSLRSAMIFSRRVRSSLVMISGWSSSVIIRHSS